MTIPNTLLSITGMGVPPYSARGLTQSLEPIEASKSMRRTINAVMRDISAPQFRKYKSSISCTDQQAPALEGYWPGMTVTVDCVPELSVPTSSAPLARTPVSGSERTEGDFTFYRPRLTMVIVSYNQTKDEYGATVAWQLDLEEV